jgi:toxin ParE1/3/4
MAYRTTVLADEDIIRLYVYGARAFATVQAERYFAELLKCFDALSDRPLIARERPELQPPVRVHFHKSHAIAYILDPEGILIVCVLDGRQDWAAYFQP